MRSDPVVEPVREAPAPSRFMDPVSPQDNPELVRRNIRLALALWGISLLLFAGTIAVALVYLMVD